MENIPTSLQDNKNTLIQKDIPNSYKTNNFIFTTGIKNLKNPLIKFLCEKCNKLFSTSGNLRNHISVVHENIRPFKCPYPNCTKGYISANKLAVHVRTHTGIKPYICQICQKSFNTKGNLKSHLKLHLGIRPFICALCNKGFKSSGNLKDHIMIHHYQIKNFQCQFCNKYFARISCLKAHIRVHKNEKIFKCKFEGCGKCFAEKRNMEKHYARHMKNSDQTIGKEKEIKTHNSKDNQKDIEEKIRIALKQLDNKNGEEIKVDTEKENEKKQVFGSIEKKEMNQNSCDNIKYNDIVYLNNINNLNLGNFFNFSNYISFMLNLRNYNINNLNNLAEKHKDNYLKNEKIPFENRFVINNINNKNNNSYRNIINDNFINYNYFMGNSYNNLNKFVFCP